MGTAASAAAARAWRPAAAGLPLPGGAGDGLRVVTYNLLADKYACSGMHAYCAPAHLAWPARKELLLAELLGFGADVLCLQELERPWFEGELLPLMRRHGFEGLYQGRQRRPQDPPSVLEEGVALLYRTARLEQRGSQAIRLGDCLEPGLHGRFWQAVRQRDDSAVIALLRDRATQRHFVAASTHLFWDPRFPDIKAAQAHLLCRALLGFMRQQPLLQGVTLATIARQLPLVIGGDFNSLPFKRRSDAFDTVPPGGELVSGVYRILSTTEGIGSSHHDHPSRRPRAGEPAREAAALRGARFSRGPLALESAAVRAWGREPPVTNKVDTFEGTLDYVWLSPHWAVSEALELPYRFDPGPPPARTTPGGGVAGGGGSSEEDSSSCGASDLPPIPAPGFPSDHLALGFTLHLLPPGAVN